MTSFANAFEPSSRAAAASGPKTAMPRVRSASARPATSGASGPITTRSTRSRSDERDEPVDVVGRDRVARGEPRDPGVPGGGDARSVDARAARQAATRARARGRRRRRRAPSSGGPDGDGRSHGGVYRPASRPVAVARYSTSRLGPADDATTLTGTPTSSSIRRTYAWACFGRSSKRPALVDLLVPALELLVDRARRRGTPTGAAACRRTSGRTPGSRCRSSASRTRRGRRAS